MNGKLQWKKVALYLATMFFSLLSFAQTGVVTGKVSDKDGVGIPSVNVSFNGKAITKTDAQGGFNVNVDKSGKLTFSSVGYTAQTVDISGKSNVDVELTRKLNNTDGDVVVIGYGSTTKKDVTGSVTSIRAKDFNKGVVTAPDQLIQGKVAGLQIINNSGQPGGAATIRIRGTASVRSGSNPLYVIDGVPMSGGSGRPGLGLANLGSSPAANPLNFINPADIVSMDVLKDASATAIYGSRGANGVILVTTKRGQSGQPSLDFSYTVGTSSIMKQLDVLDGDEYRAALTKYGLTSGNYGSNVNAVDEILRKGTMSNIAISAGGGNENAKLRLSASYLSDAGIIKESDLKKYTVGLNGSFKFLDSKRLGMDVNIQTAQIRENLVPITNDPGFEGNLLGQALVWNPTHPLRDNTGKLIVEPAFGSTSVNPLWFLEMYDDKANNSNILASISPYYKFNKNLEYKFLYSVNQNNGDRKVAVGRGLTNIPTYKDRGAAVVASGFDRVQQFTHTLNFNKSLTEKVSLNALAGYEYSKFENGSSYQSAQDFQDIGIPYYNMLGFSSQSSRQSGNYESPTNELQSFFTRAIVNLSDKYLFTATLRADGSSKFGANNKYGVFPSFATKWNMSSEKFMSKLDGKLSNVAMRLGWGVTGNQEFPSGAAQTRFGVSGIGSISQFNVANPDLKWETTTTTNIGFDFSLFDKVNFNVDYFNRVTKDVLFELTFPQPGASSARIWKNLPATITNSGVEIAANSTVVKTENFAWTLGVNVTFLKNMLEGLNGTYNTGALHGQGSTGAFVQKLASGYPLNVYYLRAFQGVDPTTGQSIYGENGDVSYYGRTPNPTMLTGISTELAYKNWAFTANMNGASGHYLYNNTATSVVPITNLGSRNVATALVNSSVKESLSNPITSSDRYLEKGNYMKAANMGLSYNFGKIAKFAKGARVQLTGQNLFVITNFSGFDPEVNVDKNINGIPSNGIEYVPYPTARRFQLSFNFTF